MPQGTAAQSGFEPFGVTHAVVAAAYLFATLGLLFAGRRAIAAGCLRTVTLVWLAFVACVQVFNIVFWLAPSNLEWDSSLPLHICDLAGIAAVVALASERRLARIIVFYWGLGLSTQGFVTPVITEGPGTARFHIFFLSHFTVVATPIFDVACRGLRPSWRDFRTITLVTVAYTAVMLPFDVLTGWNYGYLNATRPTNPTLIDRLGPWPLRLLWMFLLVEAVYAAMTAAASLLPAPRRPVNSPA